MTRVLFVCAALLSVWAIAPDAQWLTHPTPGLPRLPEGKPNLNAPAPRTADRRPGLSGVFYLEASCPSSGCMDDYQAGPEFFNNSSSSPDCL